MFVIRYTISYEVKNLGIVNGEVPSKPPLPPAEAAENKEKSFSRKKYIDFFFVGTR